ncbi:unnamed protein product [Clonostachys rhizophaga]|uniref:Major facilitator superfamily (MFS) profile domain-containing protein n=1 Tax=Clonostachys rhizophaga TaxID=160324 RepID=A0A9N9VNJ7_9HYPO|nr:unnamed protein product [Clonostachys rhizophaga]
MSPIDHSRSGKPAIIGPDDTEQRSMSWYSVPQDELFEESTAYDPGAPIEIAPTHTSSAGEGEENLSLGRAIKLYPKMVGYCMAMTIPIIGWGYDLVIVGAITGVDSFTTDYGAMIDGIQAIPGNWLTLWMALPPAGSALGAVVCGWMQDRIGRKFSLMIGSIISALAISCIFFSYLFEPVNIKRAVITAGLTTQGFTVGIIKTTCLTWVSENSPTALRGSAMALFPTFTLIGQLIGAIVVFIVNKVETATAYRAAFASQWILCLGPFILSCLMPDSPAYLIRAGKEAQAIASATRLFAPKINPRIALEKIRHTIEEEKASVTSASYWACFKGTDLRRTMIVILANVFPALFGLDLLSNSTPFLQSFGMESSTSLLLQIFGIVGGMAGNAIGLWILSRSGRRNMTIISMGVTGLLWGAMGVTGFWSSPTLTYAAGGIMIAVIVTCGLGCWPAGYAITGETSSLQLRALTQGIGGVAAQGSSITIAAVLPQLFGRDKAALGAKTGFVFCGLCAIGVLLTWLWIPEMKGRSMQEIDYMFAVKLPTRKFKHWKSETHEMQEALPLRDN